MHFYTNLTHSAPGSHSFSVKEVEISVRLGNLLAWIMLKLCRVGEHQHQLAHQCLPLKKKLHTHTKCEVKHNWDMGMGLYGLMGVAFMTQWVGHL